MILMTGQGLSLNVLFRYLEPVNSLANSETARSNIGKDSLTNSPTRSEKVAISAREKTDVSLPDRAN